MRRTPVVLAVASIAVAVLASASHGQGSPPNVRLPGAPSPVLAKAIAAQTSHARTLRNAPEIVGSGVGLTPSGQPVITVFTTRSGVNVPKTIDGVRVQTVVTGMIVARSATARYPRPVPIGVSSGHFELATGTLGARVTNGADTYALSNNHVFAGGNMASIGDAILQPGPIEDGGTDPADRIGTLADYQAINFDPGSSNTIDAAIALTTPGDVGTATLPDGYGSPSSTTVPASVGLQVQKYGRTTGLTSGSINAVNVDVDVCYLPLLPNVCLEQAHFGNQFSIPDNGGLFSDAGDSGSLVVTQGSNNPVGLLFAGGDGLTIANPIDAVLQRFNVTIDSGAPSDGKPSAPFGLQATPGDGQISLSWNAPASDGGSSAHGLQRVPRHEPRRRGPDSHRHRLGHDLPRHDCRQRHHLLLQGDRHQRGRRGPEVERSVGDTDCGGHADDPACRPRQLQPRQRDALRRGQMDERNRRRLRDRVDRLVERSRVHVHDHLYRVAQHHPVRSRRRVLYDDLDAPGRRQRRPSLPPPSDTGLGRG